MFKKFSKRNDNLKSKTKIAFNLILAETLTYWMCRFLQYYYGQYYTVRMFFIFTSQKCAASTCLVPLGCPDPPPQPSKGGGAGGHTEPATCRPHVVSTTWVSPNPPPQTAKEEGRKLGGYQPRAHSSG